MNLRHTGVFATSKELAYVIDLGKRPLFFVTGKPEWEDQDKAVQRLAREHGLPRLVNGGYGMTAKGEFVTLPEVTTDD